jgi:hypothetical protein
VNAGTRVDHNKLCLDEEWTLLREAQGREVRHHVTYELNVLDGRILRTRVSRPVKKVTYGVVLWRAILREQLCVTEDEFWACVKGKVKPDRGGGNVEPPPQALPASLVHQLIHEAGVPEEQIATMTLKEAVEAMNAHWSEPKS